MFFLVALFIVVPIAELYVIIQVGEAIGVWPTLALLLLDALLGSFLLKHQGRGAWRRFNEALAERRFPGKEVADGLLIVIGGTLLLAPGFLTDIVGLFLLIPPTRAIARAVLKRFTIGRFTVVGMGAGASGAGPFGNDGSGPSGGPSRHYDYDVTAEEVPTNGNGASRELPRIDED
ncbi:MAG TPA: FxsA family protein [Solirubrobacterales bacterium]|nr:FxsA family protein [Solirubrobacterales bacterium]